MEPIISELTVVAAFMGAFAALLVIGFCYALIGVLRKPHDDRLTRPVPDSRDSIALFRRMNTP